MPKAKQTKGEIMENYITYTDENGNDYTVKENKNELKKIELTRYEMETLQKAKEILAKVSPTETFYVECWKELNFIRLNPCGDSNARGLTFNFQTQDIDGKLYAKQMYSRQERRNGSTKQEEK